MLIKRHLAPLFCLLYRRYDDTTVPPIIQLLEIGCSEDAATTNHSRRSVLALSTLGGTAGATYLLLYNCLLEIDCSGDAATTNHSRRSVLALSH